MSSLIFFKAVPFSLGSELTAETSKGMCAAGSRWFFFSTTSLPAVVFMIRGRRSRHLWVLIKRQIFNGIHPSWVTLNRQPGGSWWGKATEEEVFGTQCTHQPSLWQTLLMLGFRLPRGPALCLSDLLSLAEGMTRAQQMLSLILSHWVHGCAAFRSQTTQLWSSSISHSWQPHTADWPELTQFPLRSDSLFCAANYIEFPTDTPSTRNINTCLPVLLTWEFCK